MIKIEKLKKYDEEVAEEMGRMFTELSDTYDGGAVSKEWIEDVAGSPWHDQLMAYDGERLVGMATVSVVMGARMYRNVYMEDLVVSEASRGKGVGTMLWNEIVAWGREKKCRRLEFTTRGVSKKMGAVQFYLNKGAIIRDTNFFRFELNQEK